MYQHFDLSCLFKDGSLCTLDKKTQDQTCEIY